MYKDLKEISLEIDGALYNIKEMLNCQLNSLIDTNRAYRYCLDKLKDTEDRVDKKTSYLEQLLKEQEALKKVGV